MIIALLSQNIVFQRVKFYNLTLNIVKINYIPLQRPTIYKYLLKAMKIKIPLLLHMVINIQDNLSSNGPFIPLLSHLSSKFLSLFLLPTLAPFSFHQLRRKKTTKKNVSKTYSSKPWPPDLSSFLHLSLLH